MAINTTSGPAISTGTAEALSDDPVSGIAGCFDYAVVVDNHIAGATSYPAVTALGISLVRGIAAVAAIAALAQCADAGRKMTGSIDATVVIDSCIAAIAPHTTVAANGTAADYGRAAIATDAAYALRVDAKRIIADNVDTALVVDNYPATISPGSSLTTKGAAPDISGTATAAIAAAALCVYPGGYSKN